MSAKDVFLPLPSEGSSWDEPVAGERRSGNVATALVYASMIAFFFIFNAPVNNAVNHWTIATLPADWPSYRLQWEIGHGLSALLSIIAFLALAKIDMRE